jgi:hypothetical protein
MKNNIAKPLVLAVIGVSTATGLAAKADAQTKTPYNTPRNHVERQRPPTSNTTIPKLSSGPVRHNYNQPPASRTGHHHSNVPHPYANDHLPVLQPMPLSKVPRAVNTQPYFDPNTGEVYRRPIHVPPCGHPQHIHPNTQPPIVFDVPVPVPTRPAPKKECFGQGVSRKVGKFFTDVADIPEGILSGEIFVLPRHRRARAAPMAPVYPGNLPIGTYLGSIREGDTNTFHHYYYGGQTFTENVDHWVFDNVNIHREGPPVFRRFDVPATPVSPPTRYRGSR